MLFLKPQTQYKPATYVSIKKEKTAVRVIYKKFKKMDIFK